MKAAQGKYLFLLGGTYSPDRGCPEWGSNRDADTFYPGDEGGSIVLFYTDGTKTRIPLIFGYTLWYGSFFALLKKCDEGGIIGMEANLVWKRRIMPQGRLYMPWGL